MEDGRQQYNMWIDKPMDPLKKPLGYRQLTLVANRERNLELLVETILAHLAPVSTCMHALVCVSWFNASMPDS